MKLLGAIGNIFGSRSRSSEAAAVDRPTAFADRLWRISARTSSEASTLPAGPAAPARPRAIEAAGKQAIVFRQHSRRCMMARR